MSSQMRIAARVEKKLMAEVKAKALKLGLTVSEFFREALVEKVVSQQNAEQELSGMIKKVESLNTKPTEQKVADIEIKLQIIYEELQRQNEILSLTHRRTSFAANFALHALDELKKTTSFSYEERQKLVEITGDEIKKSGIQFLRK